MRGVTWRCSTSQYELQLESHQVVPSGLWIDSKGVGSLQVRMGSSTTSMNLSLFSQRYDSCSSSRRTTLIFLQSYQWKPILKKIITNYYFQVQGPACNHSCKMVEFLCVYTTWFFCWTHHIWWVIWNVVHKLDDFYFKHIVSTLSNIPCIKEL